MLMFEKNGQGFWDFDFNALVELTSLEFANEVVRVIKGSNYNEDIKLIDNTDYISVYIKNIALLHELNYNKREGTYSASYVTKNVVKVFYNED